MLKGSQMVQVAPIKFWVAFNWFNLRYFIFGWLLGSLFGANSILGGFHLVLVAPIKFSLAPNWFRDVNLILSGSQFVQWVTI